MDFLQATISGAAVGSVYALMLIGVLLVFRVSKAVNFAAGQIGMFGALFAYYTNRADIFPFWLAVLVGMLVGAAISAAVDVLVMRRIPQDVFGFDLIATIGAFLALTTAAEIIFGNTNRLGPSLLNERFFSIGELRINWHDIAVIIGTFIAISAVLLILNKTNAGLLLRVSAEDPDVAESLGVAVPRVRTITWCAAGILAVGAAVLITSRVSVNPYLVTPFLIKSFIAGILGGLNRLLAPLLVAVFLGVYESWAVFFFGSTARTLAVFVAILVALMIIPKQYLSEGQEARA